MVEGKYSERTGVSGLELNDRNGSDIEE